MPAGVAAGMVALMVPAVVCVIVPMLVGDAKLPLAAESCAVNILPLLNVPLMVKGTLTEAVSPLPAQKGEPLMVEVVMDAAEMGVLETVISSTLNSGRVPPLLTALR